jgi:hypothetical protein
VDGQVGKMPQSQWRLSRRAWIKGEGLGVFYLVGNEMLIFYRTAYQSHWIDKIWEITCHIG